MPFELIQTQTLACAPGDVVFRENDASDGKMYVLLEGAVSLVRQGQELERVTARGAAFGELALIDHLPRSATAVAQEQTRLVVLDEKGFRQQILGNPMFALELMRLLTKRARANML